MLLLRLSKFRQVGLLVLGLFIPAMLGGATGSLARSDFIVNSTVREHHLTREEVVQIFLLHKRHWNDGVKIHVILPPLDSLSFKRLAMDELGISAIAYEERLRAKQFSLFAVTDSFVAIKVAQTPNSIGYFYEADTINTKLGIRSISIRE